MSDDRRYYEDVEVGETHDCGSVTVEREEMLEFAERYDPQPIHVDEDAAAESIFGGSEARSASNSASGERERPASSLIASGWFTAALSARLLVKGFMNDTASLGGRGMDDLRWHRPVRAGDELAVEVEVLEKRPSEAYPTMGHVRSGVTTTVDGEAVLTMEGLGMVERRDPEG